jgi:p-aminobenzoyl-glutamate transporter AbgT
VSEQESTVSTIGAGGKFEINNQLVNNDNLLDVINWTIDRLPNNRIIIFLITLILTRAFVNFAGCSLATMATQSQITCANNKTFERLRVTRQQYVTSTLHCSQRHYLLKEDLPESGT